MAKAGRNDLCPCGSGKKYKRCHAQQERGNTTSQSRLLMLIVGAAVAAALVAGIASFTGQRSGSNVRVWDPAHGHYHNENGVQVP
jgi:hypothetical protein